MHSITHAVIRGGVALGRPGVCRVVRGGSSTSSGAPSGRHAQCCCDIAVPAALLQEDPEIGSILRLCTSMFQVRVLGRPGGGFRVYHRARSGQSLEGGGCVCILAGGRGAPHPGCRFPCCLHSTAAMACRNSREPMRVCTSLTALRRSVCRRPWRWWRCSTRSAFTSAAARVGGAGLGGVVGSRVGAR